MSGRGINAPAVLRLVMALEACGPAELIAATGHLAASTQAAMRRALRIRRALVRQDESRRPQRVRWIP